MYLLLQVVENDNLPTKVCLNCEEKMVSFQLFVLECYKVQEKLRRMYLDSLEPYLIKDEGDLTNYSQIKSEVLL